jgi:hypothetical protein
MLQNNDTKIILENDYDSFVIKPPDKDQVFKSKQKNFFVDSRDRNYSLYPNPAKFNIELKEEYKYVKTLELIMAQIPPSQYLINNTNNIFYINIGGVDNEIIIENGNYIDPCPINKPLPKKPHELNKRGSEIFKDCEITTDSLSEEIQTKLQNKMNRNNYCQHQSPFIEVSYDFNKDNYIFSSDLCPTICDASQGEKIILNFRGKEIPYGNQEIEKVPKRTLFDTIERDDKGNVIYEEISVGDKTVTYKKNSMAKVLGFECKNYDGFIINNLNNLNNISIFSVNNINNSNRFTNKLRENQYIIIQEEQKIQRFKIKKIIDDYSFEIYNPKDFPDNCGNNAPYIPPQASCEDGILHFCHGKLYSGIIQAPKRKNFELDKYIILKIKMCHKIDSIGKSAQDSFAILPFQDVITSDIIKYKRYFNPPIPKLSELKFEFLNHDGSLYDFNGSEVDLLFNIETLNQSGKYIS